MQCLVCNHTMEHYFVKEFQITALNSTEYERCPACGMVFSKTHGELSLAEWSEINTRTHSSYQGTDHSKGDPRWIQRLHAQKEAIARLYACGVVGKTATPSDDSGKNPINAIDYGCGDGKLCDMLATDEGITVGKYDKYMGNASYMRDEEVEGKQFPLVISTSVLEHLRSREEIDAIIKLVDRGCGIFALHTLVCEEVPCDPAWFYLVSVHCAFFSNKSMALLYKEYGFECCFYAVDAQMWFMCMNKASVLPLQEQYRSFSEKWVYSDDFVDYWKQKPYRVS